MPAARMLASRRRARVSARKREARAAEGDALDAGVGPAAVAQQLARRGVEIGAEDPGDDVTFTLAANPGASAGPLAKVASGGELSRMALAIAVTTSRLGTAQTLIFDEVDSGVGGAVAETVGRLMRQLGVDLDLVPRAEDPKDLFRHTQPGAAWAGVRRVA